MTAPQQIIPNIWCNRTAEAAANFYVEAFTAAGISANAAVEGRYPETDLPEFQREFAGQPVTIALSIAGTRLTLINAGDQFRPGPGFSFILNFDPLFWDSDAAQAHNALDNLWEKLSDTGRELMPLGEYPFSAHYGWVEDRFGVNWQLMLTNPEGDPRPFVIPSMMFDGSAQDRAQEAAEFYVERFQEIGCDASLGHTMPYGEASGKAKPGALAFGEFHVGDQWFAVMDNGSGVDHGFGGVSLQVNCADQAEIDTLWGAMSAVAEVERCGWLQDKFGLAWQIVPENMGELMQRPGAYSNMLRMTKLVIDEF